MNINLFRASLLSVLLILIKPIEFIASNFMVTNSLYELFSPLILVFFLVFLFLISTHVINSFLSDSNILEKILIFIGIFFYLQFYWFDVSIFLQNIFVSVDIRTFKIISIVLILLISIVFTKLNSNKVFFRYSLIISFLVLFSQLIIILSDNNFYNIRKGNTAYSKLNTITKDVKNITIKSSKTNNVYYIVLDGLTSLKRIEELPELNTAHYIEFVEGIEVDGFHHLSNSKSSYNITYLTIASILNLKYFDKDYTYSDRYSFFPFMLYKRNNPPPLLNVLSKLDYDFFYSGNGAWANCQPDKIVNAKCLNKNYKNIVLQFMMNDGVISFLRNSFIFRIHNILITESDYDGIENFLSAKDYKLTPNSSSFYFIHNLAPHPPYYNKLCELDLTQGKKDWKSSSDYYQSIQCTFNKVSSLLSIIKVQDPDALIVIQGDHGTDFNYNWKLSPLSISDQVMLERFSIFNAIKLPDDCKKPQSLSYSNVDTIQLVLSCIEEGVNEVNPQNLSYAGAYWGNDYFGRLLDVSEKVQDSN